MSDQPAKEKGFELPSGVFVPFNVSEKGKDLMLIDRIAQRPPYEVLDEIDSGIDVRGTSALALIATSLRAAFPDWSIQRIIDTVEELDLGELKMVGLEEESEEADARPPDEPAGNFSGGSSESSKSPDSPPESRFATPV